MPQVETIDYPHDWPESDMTLMSNYDRAIDRDVEAQLRGGNLTASYPAWDFCAQCWFENGKFKAAVRRYHSLVATFEAETPDDLMDEVSDQFGYK